MKRVLLIIGAALFCFALNAGDLTGKRIYVNPGHGSFGPNDRPMATIPYPNLPTTGMPDTCGFYETNTNLWKCLYLGERLEQAGAYVMYSRKKNGPWPYTMVNGDYPDYVREEYMNLPDYEKYNRSLSEICEEVEANNMDLFISVHSNAASDGSNANYPLYLYRGYDAASTEFEQTSKAIGAAIWPYRFDMMNAGYDIASAYTTSQNLRGDINFYGSSSTRHSAVSGKDYTGYLGVLKHGAVGGLWEGYFHTYQPARHRALNPDHCKMEGIGYYRGIIDYYGADRDTKGYILGTVKDLHEKIVHHLFTYTPKTNDQWLPCNGAKVVLYKGGTKVGEYDVDTLYNGVFYFGDLEPGADYTLDATCDGYKPLFDEYKTPITVTANTTTFPMIFLESESYVPPKEVFYTYPDPKQDAWLGMPSKFVFGEIESVNNDVLKDKTIRRSILRNDTTMYVLAIDESKNPYLYLFNPSTMELRATLPTDFCTVSSEGNLKLSDIAVTAEGVLIGCNEEKVAYTPTNNWLVYKWTQNADGSWSGAVWLNTTNNETAGNYLNAIAGSTLAYAGTLEDGVIYSTAYTIGSDAHAVRYFLYTISDGVYAGALRNQDGTHKLAEMGHNIKFTVSPLGDNKVIITDDNIVPMQWEVVNATASAPVITQFTNNELKGVSGISCFKYAKHSLMIMPLDSKLALYDITAGLENASEIRLKVDEPLPTDAPSHRAVTAEALAYNMAAATVKGVDLTMYWHQNDKMLMCTTMGKEQPLGIGTYAYDLKLEQPVPGEHVFKFKANADALGRMVLYDNEDNEVWSAYVDTKEGENALELPDSIMPGEYGAVYTWAIELTGENVSRWGRIHDQKVSELGITRGFCSVDNNPESDYFGRIYIYDRAGANAAGSGLHAFNQDYTRINSSVLKGGRNMYGSPYRSYVDDQGYIWMSDGSDGYSGVIVANPADLEGTFEEFFDFDNRDNNGVLTKAGVELGSSALGLSVYGKGADTKLLVYNEDAGSTLGTFTILSYNIGTAEGIYKHKWSEAPSARMNISGQAAYDGYPLGCSHGIWVAQRRSAGNNNASATALKFYSWDGTEQLASYTDEYKEIIDGCMSGAIALNEDESELVMIDGSKNLLVFDIAWEGDKPILALRYSYPCDISDIREMHFDYAGNLVTSGTVSFTVFAMPHENTTVLTPAKKSLKVVKTESQSEVVKVTGVSLNVNVASLKIGESVTLTATIEPDDADNKNVVWSSSDMNVATVADGVVTAVSVGDAIITVTTVDGSFTAECNVKVNLKDGIETLSLNGISYRNYIIYNEQGLQLQVYNSNGQMVASGRSDINMSGMPQGVYVIQTGKLGIKIVR